MVWDMPQTVMWNCMDSLIQIGQGVQMIEIVLLVYVSFWDLLWYYGLARHRSLLHSTLQKHSILQLVILVRKQYGFVSWFLDYLITFWIQLWYIVIIKDVWSFQRTLCSMTGRSTLRSSIISSVIKSRREKWFSSTSPSMSRLMIFWGTS